MSETVEAQVEVEEDITEAPVPAAQENGKYLITYLKQKKEYIVFNENSLF